MATPPEVAPSRGLISVLCIYYKCDRWVGWTPVFRPTAQTPTAPAEPSRRVRNEPTYPLGGLASPFRQLTSTTLKLCARRHITVEVSPVRVHTWTKPRRLLPGEGPPRRRARLLVEQCRKRLDESALSSARIFVSRSRRISDPPRPGHARTLMTPALGAFVSVPRTMVCPRSRALRLALLSLSP